MKLFKPKKLDLEKIFNEHKFELELLLLKDFTGYIPKDVQEPVLGIFREYGEAIERWTLWQSWYINNKAVNDPLKITVYNGMMILLKSWHTMAKVNKKNFQPPVKQKESGEVATPWIDSALEDLDYFRTNAKNKNNQTDKNESTKSSTEVQGGSSETTTHPK